MKCWFLRNNCLAQEEWKMGNIYRILVSMVFMSILASCGGGGEDGDSNTSIEPAIPADV